MAKNTSKQLDQNKELTGKATFHKNLDREIIVVSEDKARLQLIEYQNTLRSRRDWIAPLTTGLSFLVTIVAVDKFQNAFFFSAAVWEAIINIGLALSLVWLLVILSRIYKNRNKGGINELIDQLKGVVSNLESEPESSFVEKFRDVVFGAKRKIQGKRKNKEGS